MRRILASLLMSMLPLAVLADPPSPVGVWKTIDDGNGQARALVKITEVAGELRGTIIKIFPAPGEDPDPHCEKCSGERKNAPVLGMTILYGLHHDADGNWSGGEILDPDSGATYHSKVSVAADGQSLTMRGYLGLPMLGRSQTWQRVE